MADGEKAPHQPNFVIKNFGTIREDNWGEYKARGFRFIGDGDEDPTRAGKLGHARMYYGDEHVYTGDAWDETEARPLRHKPGISLYADPEGLAIKAEAEERRHP
jgi:hypothetical protein